MKDISSVKNISPEEYNKIRSADQEEYLQWQKKVKIISLGWDCLPRAILTWWGVKPDKAAGELSYPFDLAMHNLSSTIKILQTNFIDYLDDISFDAETKLWYNHKYYIKYNHDETLITPQEFRDRYTKRIANFFNAVKSEEYIFFIYHTLPDDKKSDIHLLRNELARLRENKKFHLIIISDTWTNLMNIQDVTLCYCPLPYNEYVWWNNNHYSTIGIEYEKSIINQCVEVFRKENPGNVVKRNIFTSIYHYITNLTRPNNLKYDLIVPLGENCSCAQVLKEANLRKFSLPFDWSGLEIGERDSSGGFCTKCELIANHCENMLNLKDFIEYPEKAMNHRYVVNQNTGLRYMHDFSKTIPISEQFNDFQQKYQRRISRLYTEIDKAKSILIVYNRPMIKKYYRLKDYFNLYYIYGALWRLRKIWKKKKFHFLFFLHDENIAAEEYYEYKISSAITFVYLNHTWQDSRSFEANEWLGNKKVVLEYLKNHVFLKK